MPALSIAEIEDVDIEGVVALWARCGLTRPWNDPTADIAFARSVQNATILVGRKNGRIAASAMVGHDGHRGNVYYVSVDSDLQGEGLGREIMTAAENWLRAQGIWKINLMVRADNDQVIEFYRALGYEIEERINLSKWLSKD